MSQLDDIQFNGNLVFSNLVNSTCVNVAPVDNLAVNSDVYVGLMLVSTDRAAAQLGSATLVVRDNDSKKCYMHKFLPHYCL